MNQDPNQILADTTADLSLDTTQVEAANTIESRHAAPIGSKGFHPQTFAYEKGVSDQNVEHAIEVMGQEPQHSKSKHSYPEEPGHSEALNKIDLPPQELSISALRAFCSQPEIVMKAVLRQHPSSPEQAINLRQAVEEKLQELVDQTIVLASEESIIATATKIDPQVRRKIEASFTDPNDHVAQLISMYSPDDIKDRSQDTPIGLNDRLAVYQDLELQQIKEVPVRLTEEEGVIALQAVIQNMQAAGRAVDNAPTLTARLDQQANVEQLRQTADWLRTKSAGNPAQYVDFEPVVRQQTHEPKGLARHTNISGMIEDSRYSGSMTAQMPPTQPY